MSIALAAFLSLPTAVYAHGVNIKYTSTLTVEIVAKFDGGDPMSDAQVAVYAPNSPDDNPWMVGQCDEDGRFSFTPDVSIPGTWEIQVRSEGHGDWIKIDIAEGAVTGGSSSGLSTGQIILMSACVIWGLVGTALYFRRRRA